MYLDAVDHVQLAMPPGGEDEATAFYEGILAIRRVPKPDELAARGGCWFERGALRIHLGVQDPFVAATKAHVAFACIDLDLMVARLVDRGVPVEQVDGPEGPQAYAFDPFGNRLEFRGPRPDHDLPGGAARLMAAARATEIDDLDSRVAFITELDRLKAIERRSFVLGELRRENTAEHSWHVAMLAIVLARHAGEPVDIDRVVRMLLVHDIVEIDAGDTFVYDDEGAVSKADRERAAADRLFGLLPSGLGQDLRGAWEEHEHGDTAEARFARAVDRLAPLLLNASGTGLSWRRYDVDIESVRRVCASIGIVSDDLAAFRDAVLEQALADGLLTD